MFGSVTQVQGRGRAGGACPSRERRVGHRGRHAAPVPRPGAPPVTTRRDRPGRGHRRGHDLPGLRRQDRTPRRGPWKRRLEPPLRRTPPIAGGRRRPCRSKPVSSRRSRSSASAVLYVFRVLSLASGNDKGHITDAQRRAPVADRDLRSRPRAPDPFAGPMRPASCAVSRFACVHPSFGADDPPHVG